ncbi:hypothetical protein ACFXTN_029581 [Malus domestica]
MSKIMCGLALQMDAPNPKSQSKFSPMSPSSLSGENYNSPHLEIIGESHILIEFCLAKTQLLNLQRPSITFTVTRTSAKTPP